PCPPRDCRRGTSSPGSLPARHIVVRANLVLNILGCQGTYYDTVNGPEFGFLWPVRGPIRASRRGLSGPASGPGTGRRDRLPGGWGPEGENPGDPVQCSRVPPGRARRPEECQDPVQGGDPALGDVGHVNVPRVPARRPGEEGFELPALEARRKVVAG